MIDIVEKFEFYPGYCYGINQPVTIGKISLNTNREDELKLIKHAEEIFEMDYLSQNNHEDTKVNLIDFMCKAIIFIQKSFRIPISNKFFTYKDSKIDTYHKIILPTLNAQGNKLCIDFLIEFFNTHLNNNLSREFKKKKEVEFEILKKQLNRIGCNGQNYFYLINAALELNIPILSTNPQLLKLGIGESQVCMNSTITEKTSFIGAHLSHNKFVTSHLLNNAGLPGTKCFRVKSASEAILLAKKINYPVVIKPENLDGGQGVFANLTNESMVEKYYKKALSFSKDILLEKHYEGFGHRMTVLNNKVIKVTKKIPLGITGDGKMSINSLIDEANKNRLKDSHIKPQILVDDDTLELLKQFNLEPTSIIEKDKFIPLKRINNAIAGGHSELIPIEKVHPDNICLAIQASKLLWLDIAGIDLIIPDIEKSWQDQISAICEINVMPQTDEITVKTILQTLVGNSIKVEFHLGITFQKNLKFIEKEIVTLSQSLNCNGYTSHKGLVVENEIVSRHFHSTFHAALALAQQRSIKRGFVVLTFDELKKFNLPLNEFSSIHFLDDIQSKDRIFDEIELTQFLESAKPHIKNFSSQIQ